jgi:hypothetical protein
MEKIRIQKVKDEAQAREVWKAWQQEFAICEVRNGDLIGLDISDDLVNTSGWFVIGIAKPD